MTPDDDIPLPAALLDVITAAAVVCFPILTAPLASHCNQNQKTLSFISMGIHLPKVFNMLEAFSDSGVTLANNQLCYMMWQSEAG